MMVGISGQKFSMPPVCPRVQSITLALPTLTLLERMAKHFHPNEINYGTGSETRPSDSFFYL